MTISINIETENQDLGKHLIGQKVVVVGRSKSADIELPASCQVISSKHVSLKEQGGSLYIIDGDGSRPSTNGIFINGVRLVPGKWTHVSETSLINLGNPNKQGGVMIRVNKKSTQYKQNPNSASKTTSIQAPQTPVPVQVTNAGVNVALVRPERERSRWKTPMNLFTHLIGLGVVIAILPSMMGSTLEAGVVLVILIAFEIYFLPSTFSFNRDQPNKFAILALNLFMGWTLIGWVVCLVWSLTAR
ncbi:superinfection immunity protein [Cyanobium sp. A2C-AMD]|uniref:superinfection immunity protein n=1 Tax=Cyanobium sp. A2C-AMD TaxID=2823695 RepID=UPI0020CE6210|nr:superinfection immunity protein [Cyanobium sp. A2C-AMD]MCP9877933.1 superinfection immunity protein [Cyanobium sp. A2C-AMD]